jgi:polyhydroxyalkanoate synthase subunit PhaC
MNEEKSSMTDRRPASPALLQADIELSSAPQSAAPRQIAPLAPGAPVMGDDARLQKTDQPAEVLDRALHASLARLTGGLSPAALAGAYWDWAVHLATSPGKQFQLADKAMHKAARFTKYAMTEAWRGPNAEPCVEPLAQDRRFTHESWRRWPYNLIYQGFLLNQQLWHSAATDVCGVTKQHEDVVDFTSRQLLDMFSPTNSLLTNPEAQERTVQEGGANLLRGFFNFLEDFERSSNGKRPVGAEAYRLGENLAASRGEVVFRNRLIELIQYAPTTDKVRPEPVLIVPAWIMKYYILDLSPHNSMVRYLTDQGFTVFIVSWKNPGESERDLGMEDYRKLGLMAALDAVTKAAPQAKVHAVGYCLGGTLLAIAAAAMARDEDRRLQSLTLLAAQTDFTEAGELTLFINESQIHFLEDLMWEQGYLDTSQMAGAFQLLRSNDLIWSHLRKTYLLGEREELSDLMAWNADATRMPYKMHSEYLRRLFLNNDLAEGRLHAGGRTVALHDIRAPIFAVGALRDHVAPWKSTYKIHLLTEVEVTYLLATGGHNAGIVSEPGHRRAGFQVMTKKAQDRYSDPDEWLNLAPRKEGSWWPEWARWLGERSGDFVAPPPMAESICPAPGTYVFEP